MYNFFSKTLTDFEGVVRIWKNIFLVICLQANKCKQQIAI